MNYRIDFPGKVFDDLRQHLLSGPRGREEAAYVLCGVVRTSRLTRLLPREIHRVPDVAASKGHAHVTVDPDFISIVTKRARLTSSAIVLTHSHPFSSRGVGFSGIDDEGERLLVPRLQLRVPDVPHGAIVFGRESVQARVHPPGSATSQPASVRLVTEPVQDIFPQSTPAGVGKPAHARQEDYISREVQETVSTWRIAIVGVGGTGSHVAQQFAMLGAQHFVLIDPDDVEETNLNRLVRTQRNIVGKPKVEVAAETLRILGAADVVPIRGDVRNLSIARQLLDCDVIIGCTDTLSSRVVLNRVVHQSYIPLIDTGIDLGKTGSIGRTGLVRADLVLPDQPCLECRSLLGEEEPANYGAGAQKAISIGYLNSLAASLAVELLLTSLLGTKTNRPKNVALQYRVADSILKPASIGEAGRCTLCDEVRGFGDSLPYPCKQDA